jgi:hypothetical protein
MQQRARNTKDSSRALPEISSQAFSDRCSTWYLYTWSTIGIHIDQALQSETVGFTRVITIVCVCVIVMCVDDD